MSMAASRRRLLDDADFVVGQAVEFVDELVDLALKRLPPSQRLPNRTPDAGRGRGSAPMPVGDGMVHVGLLGCTVRGLTRCTPSAP